MILLVLAAVIVVVVVVETEFCVETDCYFCNEMMRMMRFGAVVSLVHDPYVLTHLQMCLNVGPCCHSVA